MALTEAARRRPAASLPPSRSRWRLSAITPASQYYWVRLLLENPAVVASLLLSAADAAPGGVRAGHRAVRPELRQPGRSPRAAIGDILVRHRRPGPRRLQPRHLRRAHLAAGRGHGDGRGDGPRLADRSCSPGTTGELDTPFMRVMDGLEAFPSILLALTIMATLGPATENVIVALSVVYTPNIARLVRGTTLMNRQQTYVESARAIGMRDFPIMRRYIFANSLSPLIVQCTFVVAFAILTEASLSFLGAGVPPDIPTWGSIVSNGQPRLQQAWWISVFAGTFLFVTVLATNLIGDGLRDALDPRSRRR